MILKRGSVEMFKVQNTDAADDKESQAGKVGNSTRTTIAAANHNKDDQDTNKPQDRSNQQQQQQQNTRSVVDMLMGKAAEKTLDFDTVLKDTRMRVWKSLKEGYEYENMDDESDKYLRANALEHIEIAVMYVDLVGSTKMILELPPEKVTIIMSSFAQEMASIIRQHHGYVLKFVGDAVIGYFVTKANTLMMSDNAVNCARSMISVICDGINPILDQYDYPELKVKIGIDAGVAIVVRYGSDPEHSHVDIMGPVMNIAAKIQNKAQPNQILIGLDIYDKLHPDTKAVCDQVEWSHDEWSYRSRVTGKIYTVYNVQPIGEP